MITHIKSDPSPLPLITHAGMKNYPSGRGETIADRLQRRNGGRESWKTNFSCQVQETRNMSSECLSWQGDGWFPSSTAPPSQISQALVRPINHLVSEDMLCVCVCVCVCVCMFMWFMRTQICIITWVWHRYYKEKVIYEDIFSVPII